MTHGKTLAWLRLNTLFEIYGMKVPAESGVTLMHSSCSFAWRKTESETDHFHLQNSALLQHEMLKKEKAIIKTYLKNWR